MTNQPLDKEAKQVEVAKRFIEDKNYSKKDKDIFIELIRSLGIEAGIQTQKAKQKEFLKELKNKFSRRFKDRWTVDAIINNLINKYFGNDL